MIHLTKSTGYVDVQAGVALEQLTMEPFATMCPAVVRVRLCCKRNRSKRP
jgi:hypothetical protein